MISSEDVRRVTFDKAMRGYRCDDVDDYLKQVAESMDTLAAQNDDLQKKLVVLAQRIDQYRAEEDTLRTTMINAQRLGDNVIREAKQKAAEIIRAANIKAEDREQRVRDDVALAQQEIVTLKSEADSFKRSLLDMYRKHINLISKLPEYKKPQEEPAAPAEPAPAPAAEQPPVEPAPVYEAPAAQPPAVEEPLYAQEEPQPAAPATEKKKVDTVEFAIARRRNPRKLPWRNRPRSRRRNCRSSRVPACTTNRRPRNRPARRRANLPPASAARANPKQPPNRRRNCPPRRLITLRASTLTAESQAPAIFDRGE